MALALEGFVFPTIKWQQQDNFKLILLISLCNIIRRDLVTQHTGCVNGCFMLITHLRGCRENAALVNGHTVVTRFFVLEDPKFYIRSHIFRSILEKKIMVYVAKNMLLYFTCTSDGKKDIILKFKPLTSF